MYDITSVYIQGFV